MSANIILFHPRVRNLGGQRAGPEAKPGRRAGGRKHLKIYSAQSEMLRPGLTRPTLAGITPLTPEQDADRATSVRIGTAKYF